MMETQKEQTTKDSQPHGVTVKRLVMQFDFIFLSYSPHFGTSKPYRVKTWGDEIWMLYLHPDSKWVSYKRMSEQEAEELQSKALPKEQADLYPA